MTFDVGDLIEQEVAGYDGHYASLVRLASSFYRFASGILTDPGLPGWMRPLVLGTLAYFVLPTDLMPEDLRGPAGYLDDIFLVAFVAEKVRRELGSDEILERNWDEPEPIVEIVQQILKMERELIGDRFELMLWFIGFEHIRK